MLDVIARARVDVLVGDQGTKATNVGIEAEENTNRIRVVFTMDPVIAGGVGDGLCQGKAEPSGRG